MDERGCITKTLKIIGSKWTVLILHELCEGTKRFGELHSSLQGISPKTLSVRLDQLEKNKIIKRKVYTQIPLRVEYSLTDRGQSLRAIIGEMREWGEIA